MTFSQKLINVQFQLASGSFGKNGDNTATITGHRVSFTCEYQGGFSQSQAAISIWGLPLSVMNQLSTVGKNFSQRLNNKIAVFAGESQDAMSVVFEGQIITAFVDAEGMPDVAFRVLAQPGGYNAVKPAKPISVKGSANAADLVKQIAGQLGLGFENTGVDAKLSNPYFAGSPWTQLQQLARHGGFFWTVECGKLAIVKPGQSRKNSEVLISPQTGMVGYPAFSQQAVIVKALFNPAVKHYSKVKIQSDLTSACGEWQVRKYVLELESMIPQGRWFMTLECLPGDAPAGVA
ncbi:hypothetical protein AB4037_23445 [Labrys sp. KB_33_2]|uniref:baseplate hub protein n=1 Tax=Labrys sp. KB_33_2 TaxID=3237479 RepID=UPI003F8F2997